MDHARLAPSAASRWTHCTASVRAIEAAVARGDIPADETSDAADEGSAAHEVRADCLTFGLDPDDFVGGSVTIKGRKWPVTQDMADHLRPGLAWIAERMSFPLAECLVERRLPLSPWLPDQFGTVDFGASVLEFLPGEDERRPRVWRVHVLSDLKYGFSPVSPERNPQQMLYALGLIEHFRATKPAIALADELLIAIDQPRKGGIKTWRCSIEELEGWGEWVKERGRLALSNDATFAPSADACEWCPLRAPGLCAARDEWILSMAGLDDLDDLDTPPVMPDSGGLTPERRFYLVRHRKIVSDWFDDLAKASFGAAMGGNPDPGSKLVLGDRGDRKWSDPKKAEVLLTAALGHEAFEKKVKSPPQAEKLLKRGQPEAWDALTALIEREPGRPKLVPADDPKTEYRPLDSMIEGLDDLDDI